jgi:leader peptidase (prepilin peptidase)/N-methyltransferase
MRVGDLSPSVVLAGAGVAGLAAGLVAARLADVLPKRAGITHLVTGAPRRRRNAAVVAITALTTVGAAHAATRVATDSVAHAAIVFAASVVLATGVIAAAAVDVEHMILPHEVTIGGSVLAIAVSHFGVGVPWSVAGALLGLLVAWAPHALYRRLRGISGQGSGDTLLAILAGAWQGPFGAVFVLFAGALQQVLAAVVMKVLGISYPVPPSVQAEIAELREAARSGGPDAAEAQALLDADPMAASEDEVGEGVLSARLPMGPFLAAACLELLVFRPSIVRAAERLFLP